MTDITINGNITGDNNHIGDLAWVDASKVVPKKMENSENKIGYSRHVLCEKKGVIFVGYYIHTDKHWTNAFDTNERTEVDYWMPLPKPPQK